jgi:putative oxidoreductase
MSLRGKIFATRAPVAVVLVRWAVGGVFLSEGIQKFLFPGDLGVGRFARIGIPAPAFTAPFVGIVEIVCGCLLMAGFLARVAAIPLIIDMLVAIMTTKAPLLLNKGFWAMAHEARTDYTMLLGLVFFLLAGAGGWSVDGRLAAGGGETSGRGRSGDSLAGPSTPA